MNATGLMTEMGLVPTNKEEIQDVLSTIRQKNSRFKNQLDSVSLVRFGRATIPGLTPYKNRFKVDSDPPSSIFPCVFHKTKEVGR